MFKMSDFSKYTRPKQGSLPSTLIEKKQLEFKPYFRRPGQHSFCIASFWMKIHLLLSFSTSRSTDTKTQHQKQVLSTNKTDCRLKNYCTTENNMFRLICTLCNVNAQKLDILKSHCLFICLCVPLNFWCPGYTYNFFLYGHV